MDPGRQTRRKKGATTAMGESECEKIVVTVDGKPPEEEDMEESSEEEDDDLEQLDEFTDDENSESESEAM